MEFERFDSEKIQRLIQDRHFDEAQQYCEHCLSISDCALDDKKSALHLLGTVRYMQGQLSKAVECFRGVLNIDPKHTDSAISLSIILNDIGRYDEAKKIYHIANQSLQLKRAGTDNLLDRKFALKHVEMGDLYFKYHRYDDALEDYSRAVKLDPTNLDLRIKIAKVYAKKGFTTRAIQELQQLCHERQEFLTARIQLGLMHYSQGNIIDAQLEWERARTQDPENAEVRTYLDMAKRATETSV